MEHPFPYAEDNKRYHTLSYHLKKVFGKRVFKAAIDAGFTCPNLDGTRGTGGCAYCSGGSGAFAPGPQLGVAEQIRTEQRRIHQKWKGAPVIAYFQAHTNTYAPLPVLRARYEEALAVEGVCGLSVATRADALPAETLDYLATLSRGTYLTVELGLQTIHDETAERINRGHSYVEFLTAFEALKRRNLRVCVHLIDGLPGEDLPMMLETARAVGRLRPDAVKLHLLHILRGTPLAADYLSGKLHPMAREAYIGAVCSQLELLPPETVVERVTGDGQREMLLAPLWSRDKIAVLGGIDRELARRGTVQGTFYEEYPLKVYEGYGKKSSE